MEGFGKNLKAVLELRRMSQKQLAAKAGLTEAAISRYVAGERNPRMDTVAKIAEVLGVKIERLLGDTAKNTDDVEWAIGIIEKYAQNLTTAQKKQILYCLVGIYGENV